MIEITQDDSPQHEPMSKVFPSVGSFFKHKRYNVECNELERVLGTETILDATEDWESASTVLSLLEGVEVWLVSMHDHNGLHFQLGKHTGSDSGVVGIFGVVGILYDCTEEDAKAYVAEMNRRQGAFYIAMVDGVPYSLDSEGMNRVTSVIENG